MLRADCQFVAIIIRALLFNDALAANIEANFEKHEVRCAVQFMAKQANVFAELAFAKLK